jgi:hypothetical protein
MKLLLAAAQKGIEEVDVKKDSDAEQLAVAY